MPKFVDADGIAVFVEPPIVVSEKTKKRFQDLMIVKLMRRGVSQVSVAKLLNVNESFVRHRLDIMPREVFEHYARCDALGSLEEA
jgi:hypothetical protein